MIVQVLAFAVGVLSSAVFWYILITLRPTLKIAPVAAYDPISKRFGVKIMNAGKRQVANIEVHMTAAVRTSENRIVTGKVAHLKWPTILALETREFFDRPWRLPATYIVVPENGSELYEEIASPSPLGERRLMFTVSARDALSGTIVVQRASFPVSAISHGWYRHGLFFHVDPTATHE